MANGCLMDSVTRSIVATTDDEPDARYIAACVNACLGVDVKRLEVLAVLPMYLEAQRLREALSDAHRECNRLRAQVVEYEKALASATTGRFVRAGGK